MLLIEDLTQGGSVKIDTKMSGSDEGIIEGKNSRVLFDLSSDNDDFGKYISQLLLGGIRYFTPENIINL